MELKTTVYSDTPRPPRRASFHQDHFSKTFLNFKLLLMIFMEAIAIYGIIEEITIYSLNIKWNLVLSGESAIHLPQNDDKRPTFFLNNKYIAFDDDQGLKTILKRNLEIPIITMILLAGLITFYMFAISYEFLVWERQNRDCYLKCLKVSAWISGAFGISLLTMCMISTVFTHHYSTGSYAMAVMSLSRLVVEDTYFVPRLLPQDNPISVKANAALFLQIFNSCRHGGVDNWENLRELNGPTQIEVPSYQQLLELGLCIDQKSYIPQSIQFVLAMTALLNVFIFLYTLKLQKLVFGSPTIEPQIIGNEKDTMNTFDKDKTCDIP